MNNLSFQADSLLTWVKSKSQDSPAPLPKLTQNQVPGAHGNIIKGCPSHAFELCFAATVVAAIAVSSHPLLKASAALPVNKGYVAL